MVYECTPGSHFHSGIKFAWFNRKITKFRIERGTCFFTIFHITRHLIAGLFCSWFCAGLGTLTRNELRRITEFHPKVYAFFSFLCLGCHTGEGFFETVPVSTNGHSHAKSVKPKSTISFDLIWVYYVCISFFGSVFGHKLTWVGHKCHKSQTRLVFLVLTHPYFATTL